MTLSVIIPVYNGAPYLQKTLAELPRPSFPYEILLVDDGSTDETPAILEEAAAADPAVTVLRQDNAGPAAARDRGLAAARGDYILFCDADDAYLPGAAERAVLAARERGADLLLTGFLLTEPGKPGVPYTYRDLAPDEVPANLAALYRANLLNQVWAKVFRRDLLCGLSFPRRRWGEDRLFLFRALARAKTPAVLAEPTYDYRQQPHSLISRYLTDKDAVCREADAAFRDLAVKLGAWDDACREAADYMLVKSLWSCLTTLYDPSCPLSRKEKLDFVRRLLAKEQGSERRFPPDCGRAFSVLAKLLETGKPGTVLTAARGVATLSRMMPDAARRARHAYNK